MSGQPGPGLHAWDVREGGARTRLHLRLSPDGTALLFVNVTEVLRLSATAAHLAWLILEAVPEKEALAALRRRWRGVGRARLAEDLACMRATLSALTRPGEGCRTCGLPLEHVAPFSTPAGAPHKADLALTYACNNRCPHCYNDPARFSLRSVGPEGWRKILETLARIGVPHVVFTGGEPTLHPVLPALIAHAEGLGLVTGLNTNGRRLSEAGYAESLARAGLDHVQVTLESHDGALHDAMVGAAAFEETVAGIRAALAGGLHVLTNTTLTRVNAAGVEETIDFLAGLGLSRIAFNALIRAGGGLSNPDALGPEALAPVLVRARERARELGLGLLWYTVTGHCVLSPLELDLGAKRCNAGEYSICVEPSGDVLPCQSYYRPAGNLLSQPWEEIWQSELLRRFRHRAEDPMGAGLPAKCSGCPELEVCGGGCPLDREAPTGREAPIQLRSSGAAATQPISTGGCSC